MTKSNPLIKNLKTINRLINSLLERNLNKLKFNNLKTVASNNKIILTVVAVFILFLSYLLIPTFYKQGDITKKLKNELLSKFNLDFTFNQKLDYNFFPRPHFTSKESSIIENQENIAEIYKIKIYVSLDNLFSTKNFNINEVILENVNFELSNKNSNFFLKLLNNNFLNTDLKIENSNIFFRNLEDEVLFINKIDNLKYYYDPKKLNNVLYSENEIFNTPYYFEAINDQEQKKLYTKLNVNFLRLEIENIHKYNDEIKSGSASLILNKIKSSLTYKTNKNFFEFNYYDELDDQKFLYKGKLNFKPFFSTLEGSAEEINLSYLFGTNAIFAELLKTEIFNNKNIDFKIDINANKIQNNRKFINIYLKSKIQDGLIDIDDSRLKWKNYSDIKFTDTLFVVKDGKLFLDGKSKINITNINNIYKYLLTPKNFRKKINKIDLSFSYSFDEKILTLNDVMIDSKYNQKVNKRLKNIYFRDTDMQNKILFKNMMNDLLEAYAG